MTKIKALLLVAVMTAALLLSGCELISGLRQQEHVHNFKYMPGESGGHRKECECGFRKNEDEYIHEYVWGNTESFETAYRECTECGYKEYQRDLHTEPLSVKSIATGDMSIASPIFFVAEVESGSFDYNEEFDINLKVSLGTYYLKDGPFQIKLEESPYYEIVGDSEYTVTDLVPQENRQYVMNFTFRIKAIKPCNITQAFDFKVKFNPTEDFLEEASFYLVDPVWYYAPSDEFFFGFKQLIFVNDSKGMLLGDDYEHGDKLFYDSINREYLSGVIDENAYIDRLMEYLTDDSVLIWYDGANMIYYRSKNIRAKMTLGDEYKHLFDNSQGSFKERRPLIASTILDILSEKGFITDEEYQNEKAYIAERGYCDSLEYVLYEKVPIADYVRENYCQFVYEDNKA